MSIYEYLRVLKLSVTDANPLNIMNIIQVQLLLPMTLLHVHGRPIKLGRSNFGLICKLGRPNL